MINQIYDALIGNIIPSLPNEALSSFALTSTDSMIICFNETRKRSIKSINQLMGYLFLQQSTNSFLKNQKGRESSEDDKNMTLRIATLLDSYHKNNRFICLISKEEKKQLWNNLYNRLEILQNIELELDFYSQLNSSNENVKKSSINLIEKFENSKSNTSLPCRVNQIDTNQPHLTLGNLICFKLFKKSLAENEYLLSVFEKYDPCSLYHTIGHKKITLMQEGMQDLEESIDLPQELTNEISTLEGLRMIEINLQSKNDTIRLQSCFQAIFKGLNSLTKLKVLHLSVYNVFDSLIDALILTIPCSSCTVLALECSDISLTKMQKLITGLENCLTRNLNIQIRVSYYKCTSPIELEQIEQLSNEFINVQLSFII